MFEDLIRDLREPAQALYNAAGAAGLLPQITSTRRSRTAQARLYRRYLAGLSPLPAAPPGTSAHEFGFAFDMIVSPFEALADVGYTWQTWGGVWGAEADPVHFQYPGFVVPSQTLAKLGGAAVTLAIPGPVGVALDVASSLDPNPIFIYDPNYCPSIWEDPGGHLAAWMRGKC